ncbi:MAG: putative lipid II flippase FtsW [Bacteriovoracaceae bacterium]|nr:putative lipid II flippase FtsW [Bacteriovoracaceae bacterium]
MTFQKEVKYFLITLSILVLVGIVMVYSASYIYAKESFGSSSYFFIRQLIYCLLGLGLGFILSLSKFSFWYKHALIIHYFFILLLLLTFIPGVGVLLKGSHRWIGFKGIMLQPGELIKYSFILPALNYFQNFNTFNTRKKILFSLVFFIPLTLLLLQPDFGTFSISLAILLFVCFFSSFPRKYFYSFLVLGLSSLVIFMFLAPYRMHRFLTFLDPWKDPRKSGFQIIQSFLAFANGSFLGKGIGNSNEKLFYLPEAYNDFIFSVIAEELGFVGVALVILLFLSFIYFGFRLALLAKNITGTIFITTVIFVIGLQAFFNMGVVLSLLPTKGLNLPFISYGGSSVLANFMAIGLVFSALRDPKQKEIVHEK